MCASARVLQGKNNVPCLVLLYTDLRRAHVCVKGVESVRTLRKKNVKEAHVEDCLIPTYQVSFPSLRLMLCFIPLAHLDIYVPCDIY